MSIPVRLMIGYKNGTVEKNVRFATISYGNNLDNKDIWKNWWGSWYSTFKELQREGKEPEKEFDMDNILWFQPINKNFKIYIDKG